MPLLAALSRIDSVDPLAYLTAFGGGVVSFLSPCVLPMVPAYLSMVTGLDVATIQEGRRENAVAVLRTTALFVVGFGAVFVALGLSATALGSVLFDYQETLTRISGAVMLAMAMFLAGSLFLQAPWLYQERRFHPRFGAFGGAAPLVIGAAFGFGWTPCIGPVLGSIILIASTTGRAWAGGTLLAAYALGLGVPFLVSGVALGRLEGAFMFVKRHFPAIVLTSAVVLGVFGVVLVLDQFSYLTARLQHVLDATGLDWIVNLG
jgi:cytochrome c-type biogenesis protein